MNKLSEENRALIDRIMPVGMCHGDDWTLSTAELNRLLNAARSEALSSPGGQGNTEAQGCGTDGAVSCRGCQPESPASAAEAVSPEPPWPVGRDNAKREGWTSFFQGRPREWSPFPAGRSDLKRGYQEGWDAADRAANHAHQLPAEGAVSPWRPIETAPKDGTVIDVWRPEGGRDTVFWGYPHHECGEMGGLCDSDWHSIRAPGWVCTTFGEFLGRKHAPFTHWMPLPPPAESGASGTDGQAAPDGATESLSQAGLAYVLAAADMLRQPALNSVRIGSQSFDRDMVSMMLRLMAKGARKAGERPPQPAPHSINQRIAEARARGIGGLKDWLRTYAALQMDTGYCGFTDEHPIVVEEWIGAIEGLQEVCRRALQHSATASSPAEGRAGTPATGRVDG